jgi:O-antigen/teichoic acid export membrane protein
LIKSAFFYLTSKVITGVAGLATLAVLTRLLSAETYGLYSLLLVSGTVVSGIAFRWLGEGLARNLALYPNEHVRKRSTAGLLRATSILFFIVTAIVVAGAAIASFLGYVSTASAASVTALAVAMGWFELSVRVCNALNRSSVYNLVVSIRALGFLLVGTLVAVFGGSAYGLIVASAVCFAASTTPMVSGLSLMYQGYQGQSGGNDRRLIARTGIPLGGAALLTMVIDYSDRYLISAFLGVQKVGPYAAAYDLTQLSVGMLLSITLLVFYPRVLHAGRDLKSSVRYLRLATRSLYTVTLLGLSAAVIYLQASTSIASVVFGAPFRAEAVAVMPIVAIAIFVAAIKVQFFDYALLVTGRTNVIFWGAGLSAVVNVVANVAFIPAYGTIGAAWATLLAFCASLSVSAVFAGRMNLVRLTVRPFLIPVAAFVVSGFLLWPMKDWTGIGAVGLQVGVTFVVFAGFVLYADRRIARRLLRRILANQS